MTDDLTAAVARLREYAGSHATSCPKPEVRTVLAALERLRNDLERERVRLAACGVAAMQNTRSSARDRIAHDSFAWSASYSDVCRAVDKEMDERERAERAEAERDTLAAIVRAADEMHLKPTMDNINAWADARAKWEGK